MELSLSVSTLLLLFPKVLTKAEFYFFMRQMKMIRPAAERACYLARSVDETPTPAVLKEALETVSEIGLLPHPGSFTVSLAIFRRV